MFVLVDRLRLRLWDCRISLISVVIGFAAMVLLSPAQDLLLEIRGVPSIIGFGVIVLVFWSLPVHNAAARAVEAIARPVAPGAAPDLQHAVDRWLPGLLGLATLVVIFLAARATARDLGTAHSIAEIDETLHVLDALQLCMAGAAPLYAAYFALRGKVLASDHRTFPSSLLRAMPTAIGAATLLVLSAAILDPSEFVWRVGREDLIPLLLGGWVPAFGYLALLSHRSGWPITTVVLVLLFLVAARADRFHDLRTFRSADWQALHQGMPGAVSRQAFVGAAIDGWMAANGCSGAAEKCPPAVLIAAEGGGSRAAFYTGTVLGALLDATEADRARYRDFGNAIFAMSGVSGGALGITLARTALLESPNGLPPCRKTDDHTTTLTHRDPSRSWRACLQFLASGDYLSPTIVGTIFRDTLALVVSTLTGVDIVDRAGLLEQAIEEHYNHAVAGERTPCGDAEDRRGLCRPFGYLPAPGPGRWLPLLLLNATSVDSGRQVIASDLYLGAESPDPAYCRELFPHSYSIYEILSSGGGTDGTARTPQIGCLTPGIALADDLRLSTAVVMSSRFPVVSPKGNIRNRDGVVIEQVVDGSFFDNTGLESLMPLVPVLQDRGLSPLVIHIANKPWELRRPGSYEVPGRPTGRNDPHHVRVGTANRTSWMDALEAVSSPLLALNSARSGHVERAEEAMKELVARNPGGDYVSPRLYPAPELDEDPDSEICEDEPSLGFSLRNLSMSWWLSPLVRRLIDAQLCDPRDALLLADVLERMERPPTAQ